MVCALAIGIHDAFNSVCRLDGLNKDLDPWYTLYQQSFCVLLITEIRDSQFYMGEFRNLCTKEKMHELQWPQRDYIVQIARFDPAKGNLLILSFVARLLICSNRYP